MMNMTLEELKHINKLYIMCRLFAFNQGKKNTILKICNRFDDISSTSSVLQV